MPLPPLLEVVPLAAPVQAEVTIPGSKSITNRALALAALTRGTTRLQGALWSEDTRVMVDCLGRLGFAVQVEPDAGEPANRRITVVGCGGEVPRAGTPEAPLPLHVGNAGTATRILTALVCLGRGSYRLSGVPRMHERPQAALFEALTALGYRIEATGGRLPVVVHGSGPRPGRTTVSVAESSQYASALLLAGGVGGWQVDIVGANPDELPYVEMTAALVRAFPPGGGEFWVEPDASSGSYFVAADFLLARAAATAGSRVSVRGWPTSGWQIDAAFPRHLPLPPTLSREKDLGDSIMTAIALAPLAAQPTAFTDLGRLRVQECERVVALRTELLRCGAKVIERGDTLTVTPGPLHGAEIETYGDHRMAMCFATLGLVVPGITIRDPACVGKTFPNFFAKLAAPPPHGLGATVRAPGAAGPPLPADDLVVD
jgi:3-phosphoshikimate 1-carboxyvinyltransferase